MKLNNKSIITLNIDDRSLQKIDRYAKDRGLSRSSAMRLIINTHIGEPNEA